MPSRGMTIIIKANIPTLIVTDPANANVGCTILPDSRNKIDSGSGYKLLTTFLPLFSKQNSLSSFGDQNLNGL